MIAVDSSVLLDMLTDDRKFAAASANAIEQALASGDVVVCDAVVAEVQTMLATDESAMDVLDEYGIHYLSTTVQAAVRAGFMQRRFRDRGGRRERVVADFLIGAHALLQCQALITRDAGFFRDYFKGLKVIVPQA
ncbi:MAG: type II toxin-antitoxin system VapC family toxin [Rubrivivax sp.]|nr:type II toxin-antitoxin system VapC family toxin [Rubrivivax sp.]